MIDPKEAPTVGPALAASANPVAVIGRDWQLLYTGPGNLSAMVKEHGLRVGSPLYAAPPDERERCIEIIKRYPLPEEMGCAIIEEIRGK